MSSQLFSAAGSIAYSLDRRLNDTVPSNFLRYTYLNTIGGASSVWCGKQKKAVKEKSDHFLDGEYYR